MNLFINKVISSILQIILFAIIPFIWWCITARKQQSFTKWIGLKKIEGGRKTVIAIILVSVAFLASGVLTSLCGKRHGNGNLRIYGTWCSGSSGNRGVCCL